MKNNIIPSIDDVANILKPYRPQMNVPRDVYETVAQMLAKIYDGSPEPTVDIIMGLEDHEFDDDFLFDLGDYVENRVL